MLVDTHCHLDFPEFDNDRDDVIGRSKEAGIGYIINIGSSLKGSQASLELAIRYEHIYATVGVHPHEADSFDEKIYSAIKELARRDKVVAIGETGLDYYRNYSRADNQKALFTSLILLAKDLNLPLAIHSRLAEADTLKILKNAMPVRCVVHCFSGNEDFLKGCLDLGFFISFTCNVTFKKAKDLRLIVKEAPLEKILLETDSPYLSPEGFRGKRNEPLNVKILAEAISVIKQVSVGELAKTTTANAKRFFNLKGAV